MIKTEFDTQVKFFDERDKYKVDLRKAIKKHGVSALPKNVQDTIPTDFKVLYELPWRFYLKVWFRILQMSYIQAENRAMNGVLNG